VQFSVKTLAVNRRRVEVQLWEAPLSNKSLSAHGKDAHGILLVFDQGRRASFGAIEQLGLVLRDLSALRTSIVGHKRDTPLHTVPAAEALSLMAGHGMRPPFNCYHETCLQDSLGIHSLFMSLIQEVVRHYIDNPPRRCTMGIAMEQQHRGGWMGGSSRLWGRESVVLDTLGEPAIMDILDTLYDQDSILSTLDSNTSQAGAGGTLLDSARRLVHHLGAAAASAPGSIAAAFSAAAQPSPSTNVLQQTETRDDPATRPPSLAAASKQVYPQGKQAASLSALPHSGDALASQEEGIVCADSAAAEALEAPQRPGEAAPAPLHAEGASSPSSSSSAAAAASSPQLSASNLTLLPSLLDGALDALEREQGQAGGCGSHGTLRAAVITPGSPWRLLSSPGGAQLSLRPPAESLLGSEEQGACRQEAFALLHTLSRSGALPLAGCELHLLLAVQHAWGEGLMDTVLHGAASPLHTAEAALLAVARVLQGAAQ
jgi:hypothetical protein